VAAWQRSAHGGHGRVVIGIDEVDKIRDGDRAEAFLNDIKAIFGTPGCLYLSRRRKERSGSPPTGTGRVPCKAIRVADPRCQPYDRVACQRTG
jgi:hypothetical protein